MKAKTTCFGPHKLSSGFILTTWSPSH